MKNRKHTLPVPLAVLLALAVGLAALTGLGSFLWLNPGKLFSPTEPANNRPFNNSTAGGPEIPTIPTIYEIASTIGDTLYGYGYIVTVGDTDHSDIFNDHFVASQDHTMRAYYVTIESDSPSGIEVDPHFWRLFDGQTPAYPEVYVGKDPALVTAKALTKGEKLQGWVTFEIPKGANHFRLAYDIPNSTAKARFVFDVG